MSTFKPLLASPAVIENLSYPLLASPKYDGFRCLINGMGNPMSRNIKPIPNGYVFSKLTELNMPKLDGELLTYTNDKVDDFNTVQSKLTKRDGMPDFRYVVFDSYDTPDYPFYDRNTQAAAWINHNKPKRVEHVKQIEIADEKQLMEYEAEQVALGWEGIMIRSFEGRYKFGRSTANEGILLKVKRFEDSEGTVEYAYEFKHNANEATRDANGHMVRSSHKDNMIGMDKLGGFTINWNGVTFDLGTGFNDNQRNEYWQGDRCVGRTVKFKYQGVGPNGKPRFPVFLGFREIL